MNNQTSISARSIAALLVLILIFAIVRTGGAQTSVKDVSFRKVKLLQTVGGKHKQRSAKMMFGTDSLRIAVGKGDEVEMRYEDIVSAEYSYSKSPRWKTGLGLSAAAVVFPPLWFVTIPLGFTKHRRHWLTIRTKEQFAVLKISKSNRKLIIPTFETRTGIEVEAVGEDK